ncbi:MAG: T9SS type A sorting domain-containing protein [Bacteroidales bacterium]|nr:T9SS type A sorting domain-containing protein [Bacteroidales bacterium]
MKKLLLVVFVYLTLFPFIGNSQTIYRLNSLFNQRTFFTCDAIVMDEGLSFSNYNDSSDYWAAFCPSYSTKRMKINFSEFDIHPSDRFEIYYGVGINGNAYIENPQQPYFTNQELLGREIIVPLTDTSGCLTLRMISDSALNAPGFTARLTCIDNCQIPIADLDTFFIKYNALGQATNVPVRDVIDTIYNSFDTTFTTNHYKALNFCDGDSVVFVAKPLFPENNSPYAQSISSCIFDWAFGDGTTQTVSGSNMVGHKFTDKNINFVSLKITDANQMCESTNDLKIKAIRSKLHIKSMHDSLNICSGTTFDYWVGYENYNDLILSSNFNTNYSYDSTTLIPDGPNCWTPCLEAKITVDNFAPGSTVESVNDILSVCMNIEHSFAGDLSIELVCPNGSSTILKHFTHSGGAHLGMPIDQSYGCDPNNPLNAPGIGWNYCFSNQLLDGQRGVISGTSMGSPIDSSHIFDKTGYFQTPIQSATNMPAWEVTDLNGFSNLIGCPINGDWQIRICDYWGADNGYLFSWDLEFARNFQNTFVVDNVTMNGAYVIGQQDSVFTIAPPLEIDTMVSNIYKINLMDEFGCTFDTSFYLNLIQTPIVNLGNDTSIVEPITLYAPTSLVDNYTYLWRPTQQTSSSITTPNILECDSTINYIIAVINETPQKYCYGYDNIFVRINPTPTIPINLDAQINIPQNNIILTWESEAMKYDIYRNETYIATTTYPIYIDPNVNVGENYCYRIKAINNTCESEFSENLCKNFIGLNTISKDEPLITLYPNPAKSITTLKVEGLEQVANVSLYDLSGRMLKQLKLYPNQKELEIDLSNLSNGVYNIRIENNDFKKVKKLVISK